MWVTAAHGLACAVANNLVLGIEVSAIEMVAVVSVQHLERVEEGAEGVEGDTGGHVLEETVMGLG
jgi:hypothetical protein